MTGDATVGAAGVTVIGLRADPVSTFGWTRTSTALPPNDPWMPALATCLARCADRRLTLCTIFSGDPERWPHRSFFARRSGRRPTTARVLAASSVRHDPANQGPLPSWTTTGAVIVGAENAARPRGSGSPPVAGRSSSLALRPGRRSLRGRRIIMRVTHEPNLAAHDQKSSPPSSARPARRTLPSTTTRRRKSVLRCRAVQAQHAVRQRFQPTERDLSATHVANAVGPLAQLRQCSLGPTQPTLEHLANTDVRQAADRLRGAITDPFAEAHRTAKLGTLCQHPQPLAATVPARLQFGANGVEVEIIETHHPYRTPKASSRVLGQVLFGSSGLSSSRNALAAGDGSRSSGVTSIRSRGIGGSVASPITRPLAVRIAAGGRSETPRP